MDDVGQLSVINAQFIDACRMGSWRHLAPLLTPGFRYLDGATGEQWEPARYIDDLRANPLPTLLIDQVVVHVEGDSATVSARTCAQPGRYNRYLDSYVRDSSGAWRCYHASVCPLKAERPPTP